MIAISELTDDSLIIPDEVLEVIKKNKKNKKNIIKWDIDDDEVKMKFEEKDEDMPEECKLFHAELDRIMERGRFVKLDVDKFAKEYGSNSEL
ncbi:hypothetical protein [Methanobrevibacter filiformis]|uniref:Uncharacterized protein n=1 Tax=Methanobrevibacter filiformis TaxID=55758 RepID=A0A165ZNB6_9EURY|nr:hypothetical protein [Methanobrevibacter filiformis]KZX10941.1 hypothetical protein MBFIL_15940 [Methanobrevibacter filiformis]